MDRIYRVAQGGGSLWALERDGAWTALDGDPFGTYGPGAFLDPNGVRPLPPVTPSKVVAVGLNYRDHAKEMGKALPDEPLIFLKPPSAIVGPEEAIVLPPGHGRVDYEAEVGIVIRRRARNVRAADAADYVLGLTCVNDVTDRDIQKKDVQYTRAKGFDTFAPVGPAIAVGLDGSALAIGSTVNGETRQASNTREMIFPLDHLVEFVTRVMTLHPGDVIATGTPPGVGPLAAGDRVVVSIEGIGELANDVVAAGH
ncbi:MAG: fumarylacetoacetate hydrolase family protein [Acidobacteria bacterium]|nr:fumarylacetoacetate hydrolase family protein [Acidobacteriota bacterium]MYJ03814.1 fumarylacetoacetate hydrolase family protein [Acidobacteriota bacterium]